MKTLNDFLKENKMLKFRVQYLESELHEEPANIDLEPDICSNCNGSGEGMYDGSSCYVCKGSGVNSLPRRQLRNNRMR